MTRRRLLPTVLVCLWLALIWGNSMQTAEVSGAASQGILAQILAMFPGLTWLSEHLLRKAAHFSEYTVLGVLLFWFFREWRDRRSLSAPILCGILAAMTDETIQLFTAGRSCEVPDVWIDTAGVCTGILFFLLVLRMMKGNRQK